MLVALIERNDCGRPFCDFSGVVETREETTDRNMPRLHGQWERDGSPAGLLIGVRRTTDARWSPVALRSWDWAKIRQGKCNSDKKGIGSNSQAALMQPLHAAYLYHIDASVLSQHGRR